MPTIRVRITEDLLQDIDAEAAKLHVTRSEVARRTLAGPMPEAGPPVADLDEVLVLLSAQARSGVVSAQTALLRHHVQHRAEAQPEEPDEFDEAAEWHLRSVGGEPAA